MKNQLAKVTLSISLLSLISCGGDQCHKKSGDTHIEVQIENEEEGTYVVEKRSVNDWIRIDTLLLDEEGKAEFHLDVERKEIISIKKINGQDDIILIADAGEEINVKASADDLSGSFSLSGTKENDALNKYLVYERRFQSYADSLNRIYQDLKRNNRHHGIEKQMNSLYKEKALAHEEFVKNFIDEDTGRFVNLFAVRSLDVKRNPAYYEKVMKGLLDAHPESQHVAMFAKDVKKVIASEIGGAAPEISLSSYSGKNIKLTDFKGKFVLLDFWATWCRPCIAEIPNLKKVYSEFSGDDFEIVSVCVDRADFKPNWKKIIEEYQTGWPQLFDATGVAAHDYGIEYFPTIFLLNKKGEIVGKNLRGEEIKNRLRELLDKE